MGTYYNFDKSDVYAEQLEPLVNQIHEICFREHIPFFISINTKNIDMGGKMEATYMRDTLDAVSFSEEVQDDEIGRHQAVSRGFKIRFEEDIPEIDVIPGTDDFEGIDFN